MDQSAPRGAVESDRDVLPLAGNQRRGREQPWIRRRQPRHREDHPTVGVDPHIPPPKVATVVSENDSPLGRQRVDLHPSRKAEVCRPEFGVRRDPSVVGESAEAARGADNAGDRRGAVTRGSRGVPTGAIGQDRSGDGTGVFEPPVGDWCGRSGRIGGREPREEHPDGFGRQLAGIEPGFIERALQVVAVNPGSLPENRLNRRLGCEGGKPPCGRGRRRDRSARGATPHRA